MHTVVLGGSSGLPTSCAVGILSRGPPEEVGTEPSDQGLAIVECSLVHQALQSVPLLSVNGLDTGMVGT